MLYFIYYIVPAILFVLSSYLLIIGLWELIKQENKKLYIRTTFLGILLLYLTFVLPELLVLAFAKIP